ncbi:hypothetical protein AB0M95_33705 [Sphaerisporangium sp. NPDC051017]|uniref:hypothetical protein n=1 Tax=Sphaerisporangium sp. NPDC051017 TaxID=3154636 RepID=UPI00343D0E95
MRLLARGQLDVPVLGASTTGARGCELDEFVLFALDHRRTLALALALGVVLLPASPGLGRILEQGGDGPRGGWRARRGPR